MLAALLLAALCAPLRAEIVNDVTQLNPVEVARVARPRSVAEVQWLVKRHDGPIAIGGGRYSMGGQTASPGALQIDMRGMDRVLALDVEKRIAKVEAGITWRKLQEAVDPHGLSVKIMQSYANFTVGGALSVNCHGRYVNQGPVIRSVREIELVLADGKLVTASPVKNSELFYGAIGGLGGIGVIVSATLDLEPNVPMEREARRMPVQDYKKFFFESVRGSTTAVFHNGDLYPPAYDTVQSITWSKTSRPVTIPEHLQRPPRSQLWNRFSSLLVSEAPGGKALREDLLDPALLSARPVVWRNYEASYDVRDLEPWSRKRTTYVLEEYFIPVERFDEFVPKMAAIFNAHHANVLNVSIRHALPDPGALLGWARKECFAFVIYYKQGTSPAAREEVGIWTREMTDALLSVGGTYYLPYQEHATDDQLRRAYPGLPKYLALKRRVDPSYKFRNTLWNKYFPPPSDAKEQEIRTTLAARPGYRRAEDQTFLTLPEWSIVFAAEEYARALEHGAPSAFPFSASANQFWLMYASARRAAAGSPVNWGYHAMIGVIGASYTAESWLRGAYEVTIGRAAERLFGSDAPEERFRAGVESQYAAFMHDTPWYEFPFWTQLKAFWRGPAAFGSFNGRRLERRLAVTAELGTKAVYGKLIKKATGSAYAPEDLQIQAWLSSPVPNLKGIAEAKVLERYGARGALVSLPRYEKFQGALKILAARGARFNEIAGNRRILMTVIAPAAWDGARLWGQPVGEWPVLTRPGFKRAAFAVAVADLTAAVRELPAEQVEVEHVFDY